MKKKPIIPGVFERRAERVAVINKMTRAKTDTDDPIDANGLGAVTASVANKIATNEDITTLFPDVEICIQILTASVLAPNDMISTKLMYSMEAVELPSGVNALILSTIRDHINKTYKLEDKLSLMLREAMFTKGAYVEAFIPGAAIDKLNSRYEASLATEGCSALTVESLSPSEPNRVLSVEGLGELTLESSINDVTRTATITVTDSDLNVEFVEGLEQLALPDKLIESINETPMLSTEAAIHSKKASLGSLLQRKKVGGVSNIESDATAGTAMVIKLPVQSVVPIYIPNDPSRHIGYFVILDETGTPVTAPPKDITTDILHNAMDAKASIIKKATNALKGATNTDAKLANMDDLYMKALSATITNKLSNGKLGILGMVDDDSDIYNIIFRRALSGLTTKLLYVPTDCMSYIAFEYRDNGTGKSMLEKAAMLFSIRASNMFTRIMANIKNSVSMTKISATLDENDPDPDSTMELIKNEAMKTEIAKYPLGLINARDWSDWMKSVGYRFDFKNTNLPDITIDISDENRNIAVPDESFDEDIGERIYMSFGLKKDIVMSGYDPERVGMIVANNVLLAKRVMDIQKKFNVMLSDYVRTALRNDSVIKSRVIDIMINEHTAIKRFVKKLLSKEELVEHAEVVNTPELLAEMLYNEYCNHLVTALPEVTVAGESGGLDAFNDYTDFLDKILPYFISSEVLPAELVGELSDKLEDVSAAVKTVLVKNWVDEHNISPELVKFASLDNTGKPRFDILAEYSDYVNNISKAILPHLKELKASSGKIDKALDKLDGAAEEPVPETGVAGDDQTPPDAAAGDAGDTDTTGDKAPEADVSTDVPEDVPDDVKIEDL